MDFGLTPTGGYPRIIRFVPAHKMPILQIDVVSVLDEKTNVLTVNQDIYDRVDPVTQHQVIRTTASVLTIA
jgi:hypothetical protein